MVTMLLISFKSSTIRDIMASEDGDQLVQDLSNIATTSLLASLVLSNG